MKKVLIRSLITAFVITITGAVINLISFAARGELPLAQQLNGGECIEWRGFGLLLTKIVPLAPADAPNAVSNRISLDLPGLLVTLALGFALGFIIFFIAHLVRKPK